MKLVLGPDHLKTNFDFTISETDIIGIFLSGGLDSTVLLCLIIEELRLTKRLDKTRIIAFTVKKPTDEPKYASRMLDLICNHYQTIVEHDNFLENTEEHYKKGRMDPEQINNALQKYKNIILYWGINNMPSKEIKTFNCELKVKYEKVKYIDCINSPFLNMLKPQIIDLFYKLKVEHLIPYTHSCSRIPIGNCNSCYSCEERQWGFDELNIINPKF